MRRITPQNPPPLAEATLYACLNPGCAILYTQAGEIGLVYWENGTEKKLVLTTKN